jgi:hypothetical protein
VYIEIGVQMKVIDLEFLILFVWLDLPMLSPISYYRFLNLNFKIPSKFDYKQDINPFWVRFVRIDLNVALLMW